MMLLAVLFLALPAWADDKADEELPRWGLQFSVGGLTRYDNSPDGQSHYFNDDQGNAFELAADYYLTRRLALTAGLYLEQNGMVTDLSDGIGLNKHYRTGLLAGAKFYFLPRRWLFQPHIGAQVMANVLNLSSKTGHFERYATSGYPGSGVAVDYDVLSPALLLRPQLGFDLHLFSTLSLTFGCDARIGLWGHERQRVHFTSGPLTGTDCQHNIARTALGLSIGVKLDFPVKKISPRAQQNLFELIYYWIESRSGR